MNVLEARSLTKTYGKKRALDALDMSVRAGDIYGFVGKNGAGKSTLMKIAAGLIEPTSGEISLFDKASGSIAPFDTAFSRMGALIEDPGILPTYSAFENLMCKAIALGVPKPEPHCRELLELAGLEDTGHQPCKKFSLGMKQRLGIALALVGGPDLLLLDEPFNGLDPEATRAMRSTLMRLNRERGISMVISTHVLDQLDRMATRFGVIRAGRMVLEFSVEELHAECMSSIRVRTADPSRSLALLEERIPGAALRMEPDGAITISSGSGAQGTGGRNGSALSTEDVSRALADAGQVILELTTIERDIEEHFVELMGGADEPSGIGAENKGARRAKLRPRV
ncbi:MAG: ATP-binding cassette domain-containing protein [Coriobacteriaceae bacterium]|nr:ATP-binding cassette domain-containing protein [Coriobacteriaceae bacterium]